MIDCRSVARSLTSGSIERTGTLKRLEVKLHLWMCVHCSRFARQLRQIRLVARKFSARPDQSTCAAGEDLESRIINKLSSQRKGGP